MLFSDHFNVSEESLEQYGAFNISLLKDNHLFIDPLLIYHSEDEKIKNLYEEIVKYLLFLSTLHTEDNYSSNLNTYFCFKEISYNWLGVSRKGNKGAALGPEFAKELYDSILAVCNTNDVTNTTHLEKMYLVKDGVGRDKISDMITNVLFHFFVEYTHDFALANIEKKFLKRFPLDRYEFDYETKTFRTKNVQLPFIIYEGKPEPVLLTPKSILRREQQEINKDNFNQNFDGVLATIDNTALRTEVNALFSKTIQDFYSEKSKTVGTVSPAEVEKIKQNARLEVINKHPVVFDYFIKNKESDFSFHQTVIEEVALEEYLVSKNPFCNEDVFNFGGLKEEKSSFEEAKARLDFFKTRIENGGLWKNLYIDDKPIRDEADLQRMFCLVWYRSKYMLNPEANSGIGPADFVVSLGSSDVTNIEFKLASNNKLSCAEKQINAYEKANGGKHKIIVIFYFNDSELARANEVKNKISNDILVYLINCDKDAHEKVSASKQ